MKKELKHLFLKIIFTYFSFINFVAPVYAANYIAFVSGGFKRSIPIESIERLAETGEADGILKDLLKFGSQDPKKISELLNQEIELPIVLTSRLINTKIGEAIIGRVAKVIHPVKITDPKITIPAIRAGIILGIANKGDKLNAIEFMKAYPTDTMAISLPELLKVVNKVNSVSDLIQFYSSSPLEKL